MDNEAMNQEIATLKEELEVSRRTARDFLGRIHELTNDWITLNAKFSDLKKDLYESQSVLKVRNAEIEELKKLRDADTEKAAMSEEIASLKEEIELNERVAHMLAHNKWVSMTTEMNALKKELDESQSVLKVKDAEIEELKKDKRALAEKIVELHRENDLNRCLWKQ